MPSFARGRKWVEDNGTDVTKGYDRVFVDESQDMTPQAMAILTRSVAPMVVVGDVNQRIYAFSLESTCQQCTITPRTFRPERDACTVRLYQTFRSPQSTISYMSERCNVACVGPSRRRHGNIVVRSKTVADTVKLLVTPQTCILARSNEQVVLLAAELLRRGVPDLGVVGGAKIASEIETLARIKKGRAHSPLHSWARDLDDATARTYCGMLRERAAGLGEARTIISTIHRAKGSERKHTIVISEYDTEPGSQRVAEEREVWYVALTRHTATCIEVRER
jgi:superfamily I DNA/RNA helicase